MSNQILFQDRNVPTQSYVFIEVNRTLLKKAVFRCRLKARKNFRQKFGYSYYENWKEVNSQSSPKIERKKIEEKKEKYNQALHIHSF